MTKAKTITLANAGDSSKSVDYDAVAVSIRDAERGSTVDRALLMHKIINTDGQVGGDGSRWGSQREMADALDLSPTGISVAARTGAFLAYWGLDAKADRPLFQAVLGSREGYKMAGAKPVTDQMRATLEESGWDAASARDAVLAASDAHLSDKKADKEQRDADRARRKQDEHDAASSVPESSSHPGHSQTVTTDAPPDDAPTLEEVTSSEEVTAAEVLAGLQAMRDSLDVTAWHSFASAADEILQSRPVGADVSQEAAS